MQCWIYKGKKKQDHYLFVGSEGDFSQVPQTLLSLMGEFEFVMSIDVTPDRKLAFSNPAEVLKHIEENGFFIQLPPKDEILNKPTNDKLARR